MQRTECVWNRGKNEERHHLVLPTQFAAHWQDTATGYRLEVRIPRNMLGEFVGIEVHNAGAGTPVVSRRFRAGGPGVS